MVANCITLLADLDDDNIQADAMPHMREASSKLAGAMLADPVRT